MYVGGVQPIAQPLQIQADGYLDFDARTYNNIAARFSGRIEKLYIRYAFQKIRSGQRIFDIYSPELISAVSSRFNSGGITRSFRLIAADEFCIAR